MRNTIKSLSIVLVAPIVLSVCFAANQIKSKDLKRSPAIEVVKQYNFNKNLLVLVSEVKK